MQERRGATLVKIQDGCEYCGRAGFRPTLMPAERSSKRLQTRQATESLPDAGDPPPVPSTEACPGPKQAWALGAVRPTVCRMTFTRITVDPDLMAGVPTIRGLRIPVATVVSMVADGMTAEEICATSLT